MKKRFSSELAYVLGIIFVAMGVVFMEKADFGVSMVVAPAYYNGPHVKTTSKK